MVVGIEFLHESGVDFPTGPATDRHFLAASQRESRSKVAVLRTHSPSKDHISIGRYHRSPPRPTATPLWRRLTGGRVLPFGEGFLGFSLVLPRWSMESPDSPDELGAPQIPNRYVRGVLDGLARLEVRATYPGRDFIVADRRIIGMVTFEVGSEGALLFEGLLAVDRDFGLLPNFLGDADVDGHVQGELLPECRMGSLSELTGRELGAREVAEAVRDGFARALDLPVRERSLTSLERQAIGSIAERELGVEFLEWRSGSRTFDFRAVTPISLGVFEVSFALEQRRFLREVEFSGDFIANAAGIEVLERELRLCPVDWQSLTVVADRVLNRPGNYILGIGRLATIPDTILRALPP